MRVLELVNVNQCKCTTSLLLLSFSRWLCLCVGWRFLFFFCKFAMLFSCTNTAHTRTRIPISFVCVYKYLKVLFCVVCKHINHRLFETVLQSEQAIQYNNVIHTVDGEIASEAWVDVWNTLSPDTCTVIRGLAYRLGPIMHRQLPANERQRTTTSATKSTQSSFIYIIIVYLHDVMVATAPTNHRPYERRRSKYPWQFIKITPKNSRNKVHPFGFVLCALLHFFLLFYNFFIQISFIACINRNCQSLCVGIFAHWLDGNEQIWWFFRILHEMRQI